jgi:hypothetical protein
LIALFFLSPWWLTSLWQIANTPQRPICRTNGNKTVFRMTR